MNAGEWIGITGIAVTVLGGGLATVRTWVRGVETELAKKLSSEAHDRICTERNQRVEKSLDDLRDEMERRHEENRATFGKIETATTGTHKLIVDIYRDLLARGGGR
jgi:hypothetical protein